MNATVVTDLDLEVACQCIARELSVKVSQVQAAVELLDAGNTIPFIARYRKEATQGLDELALRAIEDAIEKARELAARKTTVLKTIEEQGLLTEELRKKIVNCLDMQTLETIYLPYKPKRRTRATVARERGLQPLADLLLQQKSLGKSKQDVLKQFVNSDLEVADTAAALQGALDIVAEQWSEDATTRTWMAKEARTQGRVVSQVKRGKKEEADKFEMYVDYAEPRPRFHLTDY